MNRENPAHHGKHRVPERVDTVRALLDNCCFASPWYLGRVAYVPG